MVYTVHTLGDSTLDNLYWLLNGQGTNLEKAKTSCTEGKIQAELGENYRVISHAYDGFTTEDVLGVRAGFIGSVLFPAGSKYETYMGQKTAGLSREVKPLEALRESLPEEGSHYVVISVGGNDFRENLHNPFRLIWDIPKVQSRYLQIVKEVRELSSENRKVYPVLMFQYRTDANEDVYSIYKLFGALAIVAFVVNVICITLIFVPVVQVSMGILTFKASMVACPVIGLLGLYLSHKAVPLSVSKDILLLKKPSMSLFGTLLERFYQPMLKEAREARIPVLDLPNTFNPYHGLYISGIEPNKKGSALIAKGIAHIVQNHDFQGESMIYAETNDQYAASPNSRGWSVAYPKKPR